MVDKIKAFFKCKVSLTGLDILFLVFVVVFFLVFLFGYKDTVVPFVNLRIDNHFFKHWTPLVTLFAFLLTLYKQLGLSSLLDLQKKAIIKTNNTVCLGLIDDINSLISSNGKLNKTAYFAVNVIRERIEIHLEYCQNCCQADSLSEYSEWSLILNRYEHQLRGKIKNSQVAFDEINFVNDLRDFKRFLIRKIDLI